MSRRCRSVSRRRRLVSGRRHLVSGREHPKLRPSAWVRANAARYHFDTRRIAIVGHSFGGWVALLTAPHEPPDVCVVAMAAWNIGWAGQRFPAHADERKANLDYFRFTTEPGESARTVLMGAGWVINVVVAESVIRQARPKQPVPDVATRQSRRNATAGSTRMATRAGT